MLEPRAGEFHPTLNPATEEPIGRVAEAVETMARALEEDPEDAAAPETEWLCSGRC